MNVNTTTTNNNNGSGLEVSIIPNTNRSPSRLVDELREFEASAEAIRGLRSTYTIVCKKNGALELAFGMRRRGNRLYVHNVAGIAESLLEVFDIVARKNAVIASMKWSMNFPIHQLTDAAVKNNLFVLADWGFDCVSTRTPWISPHEFHPFVPDKTIRLDMNYE